jgi:autotransporter-associated beta strand protein
LSTYAGYGGLVKNGSSTLTLAGANTYKGATSISGGALSISADNNLGTAPNSATAGQLVINGGTLATTSSFAPNANRGVALGSASGSGSGGIDVASGTTLTYGGIIANNGGVGGLTKTDTGTLA